MPRYFFHIHNGKDSPDREGTEFPNDRAAQEEAVSTAGEYLKDLDGQVLEDGTWRMTVTRENREPVCELRFTAKV